MKSIWLIALLAALMMAGCQSQEPAKPAASQPAAETAPAASEPAEVFPDTENVPEVPAPSAGTAEGLTKDFLIGQKFVLKTVNGVEFQGEMVPVLEFGDSFLVSGKVCNNFRGPGELADGRLTVQAIASTKMACPGDVLGGLESSLFQALEAGLAITMNGADLFLQYDDTVLGFQAISGTL